MVRYHGFKQPTAFKGTGQHPERWQGKALMDPYRDRKIQSLAVVHR